MANQIKVTWVMLEDEDSNDGKEVRLPSAPSQTLPSRDIERTQPFPGHPVWGAIVLTLLSTVAVSMFLWRQAQTGLERIEAELTAVISREEWSAHGGKSSVHIQQVDLREGRAMVQLHIQEPRLPLPYRETRFYRQDATGWRRGPVDVGFWGSEQTLESESFRFHVRHRDLAAVAAAALMLEERLQQMQRSFGLPNLPAGEKIVVRVVVGGGQPTTWHGPGQDLRIPSPLLSVPVTISEEEVLVQSVLLPLGRWMVDQALARYAVSEDWQISWTLYQGLNLWTLWSSGGRLADWQSQLVRWEFGAFPHPPDQHAALCQTYAAWSIPSDSVLFPFTCGDAPDERPENGNAVIRLSHLVPAINQTAARYNGSLDPPGGREMDVAQWENAVATATVLGYAIQAYGRDRLPDLLAALDEPRSWERIIPTVFGVSAEEFETGWHAYLVEKYGVVWQDLDY